MKKQPRKGIKDWNWTILSSLKISLSTFDILRVVPDKVAFEKNITTFTLVNPSGLERMYFIATLRKLRIRFETEIKGSKENFITNLPKAIFKEHFSAAK